MKRLMHIIVAYSALWCSIAYAQTYPNRPIRLVVPFAAGGSGDLLGRTVGAKLAEAWGQQILIDNRPGAAGTIGATAVARAQADGYTFLFAEGSSMSIAPHIQKPLPFDPERDFDPVIQIARIELVLTVHPSVPATNLNELIALLKSNPGKMSYASAGIGSIHHLSMEWLKKLAGVDIVHVPYKGSGQILPDVISGQVPITYTGFAQTIPYIRAGQLKAIALGGPQRLATAPGVAPIAETFAGFNGTTSWSLVAPAGTPREIILKLNAEINRILSIPEVYERLISQELVPVGGSPEQLGSRMKSDYVMWGKIIQQIGLKAE